MFIKIINRNGKKRQVRKSPKTFNEVRTLVEQTWGEEAKNSSIAYIDSDKELITIVNDDDWSVCMEEIAMMYEGKKVQKVALKLIPKEDLTESIQIMDTSLVRSESEMTENFEEIQPEEKEEVMIETPFDKVGESIVIEPVETPVEEPKPEEKEVVEVEEPKVEEPKVEEPKVEETKVEEPKVEEETKKTSEGLNQLADWKMVEKPSTPEVEKKEEEGDKNITEETQETEEDQPSVFEEEAAPVRVTNTANNDVVIDLKIDGNDLEALRSQVMQMAPLMGFEVEKAEIRHSEPERQETEENILEDMSMCETNRSSMTHDMRDEIQEMINQKVREQLNKTLSTMNLSNIQPEEPKQANPVVHTGFTCDGCGVCPIVGARYNSLEMKDYDLCEKCEKTMHHEFPMIRFRTNSHRGFAHSKSWHVVKKMLHKQNPKPNVNKAPSPFFMNPLLGAFKKQGNPTTSCTNNNTSTPQNPIGNIFRNIRQSMQEAAKKTQPERGRGRHRNLCHIRVRDDSGKKAEEKKEEKMVNHPRFNEFKKVFTAASDKAINEFLYSTDDIRDENQLYNMAIAKFLE